MKFANHLSKKDIQKVNQLRRANTKKDNPKPKRKKKDNLSHREIEKLMATYTMKLAKGLAIDVSLLIRWYGLLFLMWKAAHRGYSIK
ncbi:hypothetical protein [Peribacillus asahii]|uniref:hypothetical protein n=1 Tax=Peribacillus asahii TaxID=228899 RepID=UPI0020796FD3|nr:hypothetical protein [Peribacillus asahii]USK68395.1 hypothetical protein LIS76_12240 [Peribacillus asahii]